MENEIKKNYFLGIRDLISFTSFNFFMKTSGFNTTELSYWLPSQKKLKNRK